MCDRGSDTVLCCVCVTCAWLPQSSFCRVCSERVTLRIPDTNFIAWGARLTSQRLAAAMAALADYEHSCKTL